MIKDITFGQYFKTDSIIHRLDPRLKTVLLIANNKNKGEIPFDLKSDRLLLYNNADDLHNKLYNVLKEMHYVDKGE